ncbi:MAG: DUF692 family protein [Proteobacteria bacterium]|nr:DUF692 family protein [Pseudomonadota bacterium]
MEATGSKKIGLRGLGLRPQHYQQVLAQSPTSVDWFEVISENFMFSEGNPIKVLDQIRQSYPVALHGVALGIGNEDPIKLDYLRALKQLVSRVEPFVVSDHLCWTKHQNHNSHDLLPVALTHTNLTRIIERVNQVQEFLGRRIAIENPSAYVEFKSADYGEGQFLSELCKRTGCGVLLDVNNLFVNQSNLQTDIGAYFELLRPEDVMQFHIAGHSYSDGLRIDTHDHSPCVEAIALLSKARERWPEVPVLLEWDDKIPTWDELVRELDLVLSPISSGSAEIDKVSQSLCRAFPNTNNVSILGVRRDEINLAEEQMQNGMFFNSISGLYRIESDDRVLDLLEARKPVPCLRGINVYQNAFWTRQIEVLSDIYPLIKIYLGDEPFNHFCKEYLTDFPSPHDSISMLGANVVEFLDSLTEVDQTRQAELKALARFEHSKWLLYSMPATGISLSQEELLQYDETEWNSLAVAASAPYFILQLDLDLFKIINRLENIDSSRSENSQVASVIVWRELSSIHWQFLEWDQLLFVQHCLSGKRLSDFFDISSTIQSDKALFKVAQEV